MFVGVAGRSCVLSCASDFRPGKFSEIFVGVFVRSCELDPEETLLYSKVIPNATLSDLRFSHSARHTHTQLITHIHRRVTISLADKHTQYDISMTLFIDEYSRRVICNEVM